METIILHVSHVDFLGTGLPCMLTICLADKSCRRCWCYVPLRLGFAVRTDLAKVTVQHRTYSIGRTL